MKIIVNIFIIILLIWTSWYDIKTYKIKNFVPLLIIAVAPFANYLRLSERFMGLIICILPMIFVKKFIGGIGMGDIKLSAAFGFLLGTISGLTSLIICCIVLLVYFAIIKNIKKIKIKKLPMAPFLAIGFIISLLINWRYL